MEIVWFLVIVSFNDLQVMETNSRLECNRMKTWVEHTSYEIDQPVKLFCVERPKESYVQ